MSTLGEYIKEVSGDSSVQGVMDGLMKGGEGVPATEATDAYSKGLVAAATEMAEDEAAMKRDNALRMTQIPTLALANGADAVGIYRHHAVDQLGLWDTLAEIGRL